MFNFQHPFLRYANFSRHVLAADSKQSYQKPIAQLFITLLLIVAISILSITPTANASDIPANQWVNVAVKADPMLQNLNIPADAASKGMWSDIKNWPIIGIHAAVLPDGKILTYGSDYSGNQNGRYFDVWDSSKGFGLDSHQTTYRAQLQDSICSTATYLNDGNILIASGPSNSKSNYIYNPSNNSVNTSANFLADDRWYATMINLPDGRPVILGGMVPFGQQTMVENPALSISQSLASMTAEIYENGSWRSLIGSYSRDAFGPDFLRASYPRAWVAPNGKIFGVSSDKMWSLDTNANSGAGSIQTLGNFKQPYNAMNPVNVGPTSTAVMYDIGKVIQVGGNGGYDPELIPASDMATVIDFNNDTPVLYEQKKMANARKFVNATVLANGEVVVTGGSKFANADGSNVVYAAEIWTPNDNNQGVWQTGANAAVYRGYHSFATLMPNGTILSTGGGSPGPVNNYNAEIFYPPYLFKNVNGTSQLATRPIIQAISGLTYLHGAAIQLQLSNANTIDQLVLVGVTMGTHSFNQGQRRIPLSFNQTGNIISATIPNANLTPPGNYQVIVIDHLGVPSLGTIVKVSEGDAPTSASESSANMLPSTAITSPKNKATFQQNAEVAISAYAGDADGTISKVEFYDNNGLIGTATSSPYIMTLNFMTAGTHMLTTKAYDNDNAVSTSAEVSITANTRTPPTVSLTSPGVSYVVGTTITLKASAKNKNKGGKITKVDFYDGETFIATDTKAPYSAKLKFESLSNHNIMARAYDNFDGVNSSTIATVLVTELKSSQAKHCATQNKTCKLPVGTSATVWYGAKNSWLNKKEVSGSVLCNNDTFGGDPILKTKKSCVYAITNTMQAAK